MRMDEAWLPVVGYEELYEVSNAGRLRSLDRPQKVRGGGIAVRRGKLLRPSWTGKYFYAHLSQGGEVRSYYVHGLVLEAFVGPRPAGMVCCHANDDGSDNRLENLRWDTHSENGHDRVRNGNHHYANRELCGFGHPLDGVVLNKDSSIRQRICLTCRKAHNREMKRQKREKLQACPQGHLFDGVRYNADGSVRQRYCTICIKKQLEGGRKGRNFQDKTHCKHGHPLDGIHYRPDGSVKQRYCKTCKRERRRSSA